MIDLPLIELLEPLKCTECGYLHAVVPLEDSDQSPVHCRECGAFLCFWADALAMAKLDIGCSAPLAITKLLNEPGQ